jgi:hypothetical protein
MRISVFLRTLPLLLLLTSPIALLAQFQQPTEEELKMTTDLKAPGADAVYLDIEEIANDPMHYQSFYARIKVLTEKGKELATVNLPYLKDNFQITDIKGRTIQPNGTVIPFVAKPEDLLISKSGNLQIERKVFTLPDVKVGSILEYRYQLQYGDRHFSSPFWEIQRRYFVHHAHYSFRPFGNFMPGNQHLSSLFLIDSHGREVNTLMWWAILPPGVTVKTDMTDYKVDVTDVPPSPDEEWMPPIQSILYNVKFYYTSALGVKDFWLNEAKDWSKDVDRFAAPSEPIRAAVAGIVAPNDSQSDKARKLYEAVQALDNTDYSRKKGVSELKDLKLKEAKRAEDTWKQKSGSSEDIALLYLAMARAAGLTAYAAKVVDRSQGIFDPAYLSLYQLDDTLVIVDIDGKGILVDPGEKMCPFETLSWRHSDAGGLRQGPTGVAFVTTPQQPYAANAEVRAGDFNLDAHGAITGTARFVLSGQEALRWRQSALKNDPGEVKKQFDRALESTLPQGVQAHVDHFIGLDTPGASLMAIIKVEGTLGMATAKRLLVPGFLFETRSHQPFVNEAKRLEPVDMHYGEQVTDQVVYHLPAGFTVEGAPQDTKAMWEGHSAYLTSTTQTPGEVTVIRQMVRAFTVAKPEEYQALRGFYQKVAAGDQQDLVLAAPPAAKAN